MQQKSISRRALGILANGVLFLAIKQVSVCLVLGQQFTPYPDSNYNSGQSQSAFTRVHSEQPVRISSEASRTPVDEHGFRQASVTRNNDGYHNNGQHDTGNSLRSIDAQPSVISSSYHRAVINNPDGLATTNSVLNDTVPDNSSLQASTNRPQQDKVNKLTPLSPPNPASMEARTKGTGSMQMLLSMGSSLMIVIGLFMGSIWLYRKSLGSNKAGDLPKSVVQILGRTTVAARQQLVLLRFGSKLVLVNMVQGDARTISEITDPLEVDRLAGLCEGNRPGSISSSFREILTQGGRA